MKDFAFRLVWLLSDFAFRLVLLLGDFAFRLVGGVVDLGFEAFEEAFEEGFFIDFVALNGVGVGDMAGEVGENNSPGEGVFPGAAADADVLALLGDPDAEDFKGGFIALGGGGKFEVLVGGHAVLRGLLWASLQGNSVVSARE